MIIFSRLKSCSGSFIKMTLLGGVFALLSSSIFSLGISVKNTETGKNISDYTLEVSRADVDLKLAEKAFESEPEKYGITKTEKIYTKKMVRGPQFISFKVKNDISNY